MDKFIYEVSAFLDKIHSQTDDFQRNVNVANLMVKVFKVFFLLLEVIVGIYNAIC